MCLEKGGLFTPPLEDEVALVPPVWLLPLLPLLSCKLVVEAAAACFGGEVEADADVATAGLEAACGGGESDVEDEEDADVEGGCAGR